MKFYRVVGIDSSVFSPCFQSVCVYRLVEVSLVFQVRLWNKYIFFSQPVTRAHQGRCSARIRLAIIIIHELYTQQVFLLAIACMRAINLLGRTSRLAQSSIDALKIVFIRKIVSAFSRFALDCSFSSLFSNLKQITLYPSSLLSLDLSCSWIYPIGLWIISVSASSICRELPSLSITNSSLSNSDSAFCRLPASALTFMPLSFWSFAKLGSSASLNAHLYLLYGLLFSFTAPAPQHSRFLNVVYPNLCKAVCGFRLVLLVFGEVHFWSFELASSLLLFLAMVPLWCSRS